MIYACGAGGGYCRRRLTPVSASSIPLLQSKMMPRLLNIRHASSAHDVSYVFFRLCSPDTYAEFDARYESPAAAPCQRHTTLSRYIRHVFTRL